MAMLVFEHVSHTFEEREVLHDIQLEIPGGSIFVLLGTSGSGKTTLLRMINRLINPTRGRVLWNDQPVQDFDPLSWRRKTGYVIQQIGLFPHYTVAENIQLVPSLLHWTRERKNQRVQEILEWLKLDPALYASAYPAQLSGGQQQRVGIARAMASAPELILMDEPFGALDPITRHEIRKDFQDIQRQQGFTTVMVTHDLMEAIALGDQICLLDEGYIQQVGTPKELLFQPANAFVQDFFGQERFQAELEAVRLSDIQEYLPKHLSVENRDENLLTQVKKIPESDLKYVFEALALYKEKTFA